MAKSTNNQRLYLDFNATSPLAPPVREYLAKGDFLFGNPASLHASGKRSKRAIGEVRDYLYQFFNLSESEFDLYFHSGATEGINQLVKGLAFECDKKQVKLSFYASDSDHSCVVSQQEFLETYNHHYIDLPVKRDGTPDEQRIFELLNKSQNSVNLVNLTLVNNETGVVLPKNFITQLKAKFPKIFIHVDAVQGPGKVDFLAERLASADAFTLSAHKFGALKGVGLSFVSTKLKFTPIIQGGDQQNSLRAGTENPDGVFSVKSAFEWIQTQDLTKLQNLKDKLESTVLSEFGNQVVIAGRDAPERCVSTTYLLVGGAKADILLTAFDLAGIDVSTGSACKSGSVFPSRVLLAMGYSEDEARSAVRISLGHMLSEQEREDLVERVLTVLKRFKRE